MKQLVQIGILCRYLKRSRISILIERDDIARWRINYLRSIKQNRRKDRPIYYLDETWVNAGHTKEKVWVDDNVRTRRQAFIEGISTDLRNPLGKGKCLYNLKCTGSEGGFY